MKAVTLTELEQRYPEGFCQSLSMFGALSDESLHFLLQQGTLLSVQPGDRLFSIDDMSEQFYIIIKGAVRFYQHRPQDGASVPIRLYDEGEQIGFVGMIGLHPRRGDAVVEKEGYLLEISTELFHKLCEQYPEMFMIFLINITREMSREISHLDQLYADKH
ncbi:cyclic nucleotide-binding domain-containing protein [Amphritea opalescens]|uniref:Cyclic nucleotide-binding domain-containing protein n=1 Tax=Amphritea opalescens TaxID=2490544 RepID=A0A430KN36_9GAMM|nr:cyclic nucleotide-binding domain-containing protein [Amphritea opalescens]RTE64773.1 cyclic nucleotide-binding domain-containing protein [Amphritea opalescens]